MKFKVACFILLLGFLGSCGRKSSKKKIDSSVSLGTVDAKLEEASGIVSSIRNRDMLWVINDSGNSSEVFLIDSTAKIRLTVKLSGAENRDWEDITIGAGPDPTKNYLYVGDIGDNFARHKWKFIYRFEEPVLGNDAKISVTSFERLVVKLMDGKRDTETMMIDPGSHDLYIVSKREDNVGLYHAAYPFKDTIEMERLTSLSLRQIVAGSISPDGKKILLKNYDKIFYWKRTGDESLEKVLEAEPVQVPYDREAQGEAMTWSRDGTHFYTLSESEKHTRAKLRRYNEPDLEVD